MTVFFYDRTFEGLLTAVFDAYSHRTFPEKLLRVGEVAPLFTDESYTVVTQDDRAERVRTALQRKLPREACNMLLYVWLSELEGSDELLFRYICKTFDASRSIALNFGDADVLETADGIFFAPIEPLYNVLPLVVDFFTDRFADQLWIVYDIKRNYGLYYDRHKTAEIVFTRLDFDFSSGKLHDAQAAEDEKRFQNLWKSYFKAISIKERANPRLHRQLLPKRFWKFLPEKQ